MAILKARLINDEITIKGDKELLVEKDPYLSTSGDIRYSLVAGWSSDSKQIKIFSDRLGLIPIFICQVSNDIYISNSLNEIVDNIPNPALDYDAVSVFLRLAFFIGNDTPVRNVKVVAPDRLINISASSFQIDLEFFEIPTRAESFTGSRIDAIKEYSDLFHESIKERLLPGKLGIPLSGGRDSRHILLECMQLDRNPECVITSIKSAITGPEDVEVASLFCRAYDLQQIITTYDYSKLIEDEIEKNELTHHLTMEHAWYLSIRNTLRDERIDFLLDGIGGDVLSNGLFYTPDLINSLLSKDNYAAAEQLIGSKSELLYLSEGLRKNLSWDRAASRIMRELEKHCDTHNPIQSFYFWNRTRRVVALSPLFIASQVVKVGMPYLEPKLIDFFFTLPCKDYGDKGFHDEVIAFRHPQTCNIRYENNTEYYQGITRYGGIWRSSLGYFLRTGLDSYIDKSYVLPRLTRFVFSGNYDRDLWFLHRLVYLNGLKELGVSTN